MRNPNRALSIGLASALFLITVAAFARIPVVAEIGADLKLTSLGVGALASLFAVGRLVTDVPAGRLTDRMRPGTMMGAAALLVAIGSVTLAVANTPSVAYLGVFIAGAGSALTLTTAMAFFARAPRERRGKSLSYMAAALLTGQAIGPALGGILAGAFDWRIALAVAAGLAAITGLPFLRWHGPKPAGSADQVQERDDRATPGVLAILYLLPAVQFSIGAAIIQTLVPLLADGPLDIGVNVVGIAVGLGGMARFVGAMSAGQVSDRFGRRWALIPGLLTQLSGLVVLISSQSTWAWWTAILLISLGSVSVNVGTTILADISGNMLGRRLGVFRLTGDAAFMVAPLLAGFLYERSGQAWATLPSLILTAGVVLGVVLRIPETSR